MDTSRAESLNFGEIRNTQTNIKVDQETWDRIFHNEADPDNCSGRARPTGCSICDKIIIKEKNARETEES
jgi:hypothetical protein